MSRFTRFFGVKFHSEDLLCVNKLTFRNSEASWYLHSRCPVIRTSGSGSGSVPGRIKHNLKVRIIATGQMTHVITPFHFFGYIYFQTKSLLSQADFFPLEYFFIVFVVIIVILVFRIIWVIWVVSIQDHQYPNLPEPQQQQ